MDHKTPSIPGYAEEEHSNHSTNPHIADILAARLTRRQALKGGMTATTAALFGGLGLSACDDDSDSVNAPKLAFTPVAKGLQDFISVPAGYSATVLYAMGDPIKAGLGAYSNAGTEADLAERAGDQHDGMHFFGINAEGELDFSQSDRGLLVMNHENIVQTYLHPAGPTDADGVRPEGEVRKEMTAHGVSVIEVVRDGSDWSVIQDSAFNRRITPFTEMELQGPVRGSARVRTKFSTDGTRTRGTLNNCANGYTPWGTYLTAEENWAGYFKRAAGDDARLNAANNALLARYGIAPGAAGNYGWSTVAGDSFQRFDISAGDGEATEDYRNEANTYGYIVEIDPTDPQSTPRKRTAIGRMGHEGCWAAPVRAGQPVVFYTGDDSRNENIYKFVSAASWDPADTYGGPDIGDKYLDEGTLYVARFNANGRGEWIALEFDSNGLNTDNTTFPFASQADVLVATRLAADSVGATKMDRPEWAAVNPINGEVYLTLTNSSSGSSGRGQGGSGSQPTDAANPRSYDGDGDGDLDGNVNGHIIRWREDGDAASATGFTWDIYAFGARSDYGPDINVSGLTAANDFSSPDGLWFDDRGILWIQTDDGAYTDTTNCMMLAAVPGSVGDGAATNIGAQVTIVGAQPGEESLRRFLVGCIECEITGITMTPDYKTMFVNIQHPGEGGSFDAPTSNWPAASRNASDVGAAGSRPRSATIVISRNDGAELAV